MLKVNDLYDEETAFLSCKTMLYLAKGGTAMKNTPIQWHPAFFAAVNLELSENRQNLQFAREYNLNVKPLEIDLLITKNDPDTSVNNEIGRIFKGRN